MRLLWDKKVDLLPLVSKVLPLDNWEQAFKSSLAREGVKYVLDPPVSRRFEGVGLVWAGAQGPQARGDRTGVDEVATAPY